MFNYFTLPNKRKEKIKKKREKGKQFKISKKFNEINLMRLFATLQWNIIVLKTKNLNTVCKLSYDLI